MQQKQYFWTRSDLSKIKLSVLQQVHISLLSALVYQTTMIIYGSSLIWKTQTFSFLETTIAQVPLLLQNTWIYLKFTLRLSILWCRNDFENRVSPRKKGEYHSTNKRRLWFMSSIINWYLFLMWRFSTTDLFFHSILPSVERSAHRINADGMK